MDNSDVGSFTENVCSSETIFAIHPLCQVIVGLETLTFHPKPDIELMKRLNIAISTPVPLTLIKGSFPALIGSMNAAKIFFARLANADNEKIEDGHTVVHRTERGTEIRAYGGIYRGKKGFHIREYYSAIDPGGW